MTVSSSLNKVRYEGNGVTTVFSFSFPALVVTDLQVYKVIRATGVATLLSYGTHYTAALSASAEGGSVTMPAAPTVDEDIFIKRVVAFTQSSEFPSVSELPEKSFESGLDKGMMAIQQVEERVGRALLFPETSMTGDKYLPEPIAGRVLEWGASGNVVNSSAGLSATIVAAQAAQAAAELAQTGAETAETNAVLAETNAETAETNAELAQAAAEAARDTTVNFVNRGWWTDATSYVVGNVVGYTKADGRFGTYMALQPSTNENPETSTGYWALVAQDGVSEIQFRKDITFSATFDTVQEMKDNGMITNYTSPTNPLLFPLTSANSYEFAQANIVSGGKFGKCLDFTQTAKALILPEKNVVLSGPWSISFWIKSPVVANTNIFAHTGRSISCAVTSAGQIRLSVIDDLGVSRVCTTSSNLLSGTDWHHVVIQALTSSYSPAANARIWIDGVSEGVLTTSSGLQCSGMDTGRLILGAGYLYNASEVICSMSALPSAASPAWFYEGSTTEAANCSVAAGILDMDFVNGSGLGVYGHYSVVDGANWTVLNSAGYWQELKVKINNIVGTGYFSMMMGDGTKYQTLRVYVGYIMSESDSKRYYLDTSKFHTYRLIVKTTNYYVFVDGVCVLSGTNQTGAADFCRFGGFPAVAGSAVDASIDYVRYYQTAAQETALVATECDTYIDDFAFFNTIITAADIAALQLASVTALQTFVDGSGITNIGRAHIAIQDLIDEREYEEMILMSRSGYAGLYGDQSIIPFRTKKRVVPTLVIQTDPTITYNIASVGASARTTGFSLAINPTSQPAAFGWNGSWQAQCASRTKIVDITDEGFNLVLGTPILDAEGEHTGEYSKEVVPVTHDEIETSKDGKTMTIRKGNVTVCIPTNNSLNKLALLGYNDNNLSVQSAKLVEKKVKIEKDKKDKLEKDKKDKLEKEEKDKLEKEEKDKAEKEAKNVTKE